MFGASSEGGVAMAVPDVVKAPPLGVPLVAVNIALESMGVPFCVKVMWDGTPAHNLGTHVPLTMGDEPGVMGGVASGMIKGPTTALTASNTVLVCGLPATRVASTYLQNGVNAVGVMLAPSQLKVLIQSP